MDHEQEILQLKRDVRFLLTFSTLMLDFLKQVPGIEREDRERIAGIEEKVRARVKKENEKES